MSFADELRKAEAKLKAKIEQEAKRKKSPGRRQVSTRTSPKSPSGESKIEDDIVALYLELIQASKFLRENYAKKLKVPLRTMQRKMECFGELLKGRDHELATEQMKKVAHEFASMSTDALQKIVISILRNEYRYFGANPYSPAPVRKAEEVRGSQGESGGEAKGAKSVVMRRSQGDS